jgi:hypothetical protein
MVKLYHCHVQTLSIFCLMFHSYLSSTGKFKSSGCFEQPKHVLMIALFAFWDRLARLQEPFFWI